MEAVEVFEADGITCKLFYDESPWSPAEWDQLASFRTWFRDGDGLFGSAGEAVSDPSDDRENGSRVYVRALTLFGEAAAVLPLRVADYGSNGIRVHVCDPADCNAVALTTHERLNELCGTDPAFHEREWVLQALEGELAEWSQYFAGDVYGYVIEDARGEHLDSLWGLYGIEYARREARELFDWHVSQEGARRRARVFGYSERARHAAAARAFQVLA